MCVVIHFTPLPATVCTSGDTEEEVFSGEVQGKGFIVLFGLAFHWKTLYCFTFFINGGKHRGGQYRAIPIRYLVSADTICGIIPSINNEDNRK